MLRLFGIIQLSEASHYELSVRWVLPARKRFFLSFLTSFFILQFSTCFHRFISSSSFLYPSSSFLSFLFFSFIIFPIHVLFFSSLSFPNSFFNLQICFPRLLFFLIILLSFLLLSTLFPSIILSFTFYSFIILSYVLFFQPFLLFSLLSLLLFFFL